MVLGPIKTGILALLTKLGHSRIFSVCLNRIGTNKDWDSCALTIAGKFKDILSMSQWYWDRLRLGYWPSYHSWDIQRYSQYVPMAIGTNKDWDSCALTIAGTFKDILSMSQRYWDRLRLRFRLAYHGWDSKGYSQ